MICCELLFAPLLCASLCVCVCVRGGKGSGGGAQGGDTAPPPAPPPAAAACPSPAPLRAPLARPPDFRHVRSVSAPPPCHPPPLPSPCVHIIACCWATHPPHPLHARVLSPCRPSPCPPSTPPPLLPCTPCNLYPPPPPRLATPDVCARRVCARAHAHASVRCPPPPPLVWLSCRAWPAGAAVTLLPLDARSPAGCSLLPHGRARAHARACAWGAGGEDGKGARAAQVHARTQAPTHGGRDRWAPGAGALARARHHTPCALAAGSRKREYPQLVSSAKGSLRAGGAAASACVESVGGRAGGRGGARPPPPSPFSPRTRTSTHHEAHARAHTHMRGANPNPPDGHALLGDTRHLELVDRALVTVVAHLHADVRMCMCVCV